MSLRLLLLLLVTSLAVLSSMTVRATGAEVILYETDFSEFPIGDGALVGADGWASTHPEELVHGVVDDFFGEGNRSGSIGLFEPDTTDQILSVFRPIGYDPVAEGTPLVNFSTSVAIFDSDEVDFYDSFHISLFSQEEIYLGGLVFDNTEDNLGVWYSDGVSFFDSGVSFQYGTLSEIRMSIDFAANKWTASYGDTTLVTNEMFTRADSDLDIGDFAAEWEITDIDNPGDNWLLFDDWSLRAESEAAPPSGASVQMTEVKRLRNGRTLLRWSAQPSMRYQIQTSTDFIDWSSDLPDSLVSTGANDSEASFIDSSAQRQRVRYYRVVSL